MGKMQPFVLLLGSLAAFVLSQTTDDTFGIQADSSLGVSAVEEPDYTCSKTKGCDLGCCGQLSVLLPRMYGSITDSFYNRDPDTGMGVCGLGKNLS